MNALLVFSVYDEHVGYCQSMNFVMGFIMMINGGNEKEAFWLFAAMTKQAGASDNEEKKFEGIRGFYQKHFPLLQQYFYQFSHLFEKELPDLYRHF